MEIQEKLKILADGAKYDVSCSSSGAGRRNSGRLGNTSEAGICHTWTSDGRCVSLLKILYSNECCYDCEFCVNRRSREVPRATFEPEEAAELTMEFYRRNYIEGLFLSSAVLKSPDHTSELMLEVLRLLRKEKGFCGYIHAKLIPGASPELVHAIGLLADRVSVNMELPTREALSLLTPQKKPEQIVRPMRQVTDTLAERGELRGPGNMAMPPQIRRRRGRGETFAPAGQTTQMIVGAAGETDRQILTLSERLYRDFSMKRVYFSAYVPVVNSSLLPETPPPLGREHRLYQADWLLRFYGFNAEELFAGGYDNLDPEMDPKITWALRNMERFPVEVNRAPLEELLRIPGVGTTSALRIARQRKLASVGYDDLKKMGVVLKRARYFLTCGGRYYGDGNGEPREIRRRILEMEQGVQLSLFDGGDNELSLRRNF